MPRAMLIGLITGSGASMRWRMSNMPRGMSVAPFRLGAHRAEALCQEPGDLRFFPVSGQLDQLIGVLRSEVRREQADCRQVEPALCHRRKESGEPPHGTGGLNAFERRGRRIAQRL